MAESPTILLTKVGAVFLVDLCLVSTTVKPHFNLSTSLFDSLHMLQAQVCLDQLMSFPETVGYSSSGSTVVESIATSADGSSVVVGLTTSESAILQGVAAPGVAMARLNPSGALSYLWVKAFPDSSTFPLYVYLNAANTLALGVYKRNNELALSFVNMADGSTNGVTVVSCSTQFMDFELMPDGVVIDSQNNVYVITYFQGILMTTMFKFSYAGGSSLITLDSLSDRFHQTRF